ncbi:MAG: prepilin-type N-terminal cleavage/methylation domain-containing protein [Atopobiaceae bacterium]|nr:prepilin-type N-terminal cleavage/methylation domain-containing protein [Atopobiaceae bacterium]
MKNYLEARREELRKRGDKGFTLMEMLIVVAIIAVLIAIAIPVFTTQLEKSRDATSVANMRSAYAEASAAYLTYDGKEFDGTGTNVSGITVADGTATITVDNVSIETQIADEWNGMDEELPFTTYEDDGTPVSKGTATFELDLDAGTWVLTGVAES